MEKWKKAAFFRMVDDEKEILNNYQQNKKFFDEKMQKLGVRQCRVYLQEIEGMLYLFHFFEKDDEAEQEIFHSFTEQFCGASAHHVYEFRLHKGDNLSNLQSDGIIIGVADGMLDEYVRLHDEQPQVIHDLCYQNGFRKSSIFAFEIAPEHYYLLQFQEFKGSENPELYNNATYQEWLRVTGECQVPLPGEKFWKSMQFVYQYKK